jgi:hypothetical protein
MPHAPRILPGLRPPGPRLRAASIALLLAGCVPAITLEEPASTEALAPEETRSVELRFLRLDAKNFEQVLTKADIKKKFPERVLRETWLLDMDLGPMITNALDALVGTPAEEAYTLPASSRNMWKLLNMTPANTELAGTSLAPLLGLGKAVGLAPSLILADLVGIAENDSVISVPLTTGAVIEHVVSTHPNAQRRRGPVDAEHPDGLYPVHPGTMPVSLYDVVTDFADLTKTFGPAAPNPEMPGAPVHPGFIADASPIVAATDDFAMTVRVNLNALPYKGVDLTSASVASVNSTSSQINGVFDFSTPDWMEIKGLVDELVIDQMTMAIFENPAFIAGGTHKEPLPLGDSPVWQLPGWQFERLIAEVAVLKAAEIKHAEPCTVYSPEGEVEMPLEAVLVCMGDNQNPDDGVEPDDWVSISVDESVILGPDTPLPPPSYFWDILLEVAQVRLHDPAAPGDAPLAEGAADIAFTLRDIPVGVSTADLEQQIRDNIQKNPAALAAIAELLNENTEGAADFYYYVSKPSNIEPMRGDWLFFIAPDDIEEDASGVPLRPYSYAHPGFYRDPELTDKASSLVALDGDTTHEKVMLRPLDVYYVEDDTGSRFKLTARSKPGRHEVALDITRID